MFRLRITRWLCVAVVLAACPQCLKAQDADLLIGLLEDAVTSVAEQAGRSIVAISRTPQGGEPIDREQARNPFNRPGFFGPRGRGRFPGQNFIGGNEPLSPNYVPRDFGTGIIVSPPNQPGKRFVLTNYHVVKGGQPSVNDGSIPSDSQIVIRFNRTQAAWATIYAADPRSDLAVLEFDSEEVGLTSKEIPAISLSSADEVRKGQFVISLGNPWAIARDGSPSVSFGMVSNVARFPFVNEAGDDARTIHQYGTLLQVDTRLGPGTSGGALLDRKGRLVGITTALAALEGYESTVGYAIPVNASMRRIINDLLRGYEVEYGFLGVQPAGAGVAIQERGSVSRRITGLRIGMVVRDSPADRAGLRDQDLVVAVNGTPLYEPDDLLREIGLMPPGAVARVNVVRGTADSVHDVQLVKWPARHDGQIIASNRRYPVWRGMVVDWPTARLRHVDHNKDYPRAVVIDGVEPGSPAAIAGLIEGAMISKVNGRPVETPAQFAKIAGSLKGDIQLQIYDDNVRENDRRVVTIRE
jgi:serine protease Do